MNVGKEDMFVVSSTLASRAAFSQDVAEQMPELRELAAKSDTTKCQYVNEIQSDAFHSFYMGSPLLRERDDVDVSVAPHLKIIGMMQETEEYKRLKRLTSRNRVQSLIATPKIHDVLDALPSKPNAEYRRQQFGAKKLERLRNELTALRQMWKAAKQDGDDAAMAEVEKLGKQTASAVEGNERAVEEQTAKFEAAAEEADTEIRVAIREALSDAAEEIEDFDEMLSVIAGCGDEDATPQMMGDAAMLEIARRWAKDPMLQKLAKLVGRIERIFSKVKATKVRGDTGQIVDVELGNDVSRLIGAEYANLAHPLLEDMLMLRLHEGRAMCWRKEDREPEGRGPIVVCIDHSGSMSDVVPWANAVALVLYREAVKRKKAFALVQFSTRAETHVFKAGEKDEQRLLTALSNFLGGGTDYALALNEGMAVLGDEEMKRSDFVFVSDGEYYADSGDTMAKFQAFLKENDSKSLGVYVGSSPEQGRKSFEPICDGSWALDPRTENDEDTLVELFNEVV